MSYHMTHMNQPLCQLPCQVPIILESVLYEPKIDKVDSFPGGGASDLVVYQLKPMEDMLEM